MPTTTVKRITGAPQFRGGHNSKKSPFAQSESDILTCRGFNFDEEGSLRKWGDFSNKIEAQVMDQLLEAGSPAVFVGVRPYKDLVGTVTSVAFTRTAAYFNGTTFWNLLRSGFTGSADDFWDTFMFENVLYACNGVNTPFKFLSSGVPNNVNMSSAPPATPATLATIAGPLTGVYSYKESFFSTTYGEETNVGTKTANIVTSGNGVTLTFTSFPLSTHLNKRRIYRTTTGGGVWLFLTEIDASQTTYNDTLTDASLGVAAEDTAFGQVPNLAMMHMFNNFAWGAKKGSSVLYFSNKGKPWAWHPSDFRNLDLSDGSDITGIASVFGNLVVFKESSTWNILGSTRDDFLPVKQVVGTGAVSHHGIVHHPVSNVLVFPSQNGFYTYNGSGVDYISAEIESDYLTIGGVDRKLISGAPYPEKNSIVWLAKVNQTQRVMFIWDYVSNKWSVKDVSVQANVLTEIDTLIGRKKLIVSCFNGFGKVFDSDSASDGSANTASAVLRMFPRGGDGRTLHTFTTVFVYYQPTVAVSTLSVYGSLESESGPFVLLGTVDMRIISGTARVRMNQYGRRLFVKLEHNGTGPCVVRGVSVESLSHTMRSVA